MAAAADGAHLLRPVDQVLPIGQGRRALADAASDRGVEDGAAVADVEEERRRAALGGVGRHLQRGSSRRHVCSKTQRNPAIHRANIGKSETPTMMT